MRRIEEVLSLCRGVSTGTVYCSSQFIFCSQWNYIWLKLLRSNASPVHRMLTSRFRGYESMCSVWSLCLSTRVHRYFRMSMTEQWALLYLIRLPYWLKVKKSSFNSEVCETKSKFFARFSRNSRLVPLAIHRLVTREMTSEWIQRLQKPYYWYTWSYMVVKNSVLDVIKYSYRPLSGSPMWNSNLARCHRSQGVQKNRSG